MKFFRSYLPSDVQKEIIRELQILHIKWDESESLPPPFITCLANTEQNLYFYPRDRVIVFESPEAEGQTAYSSNITGPKNKPVALKFGSDYLMIKVAFLPTGLYRLLRIPMQTTLNQGLNAADFFSNSLDDLFADLTRLTGYDDMIASISYFLDERIKEGVAREEPIDQVAIQMLDPFARHSLLEWASMACLSLRQFERNFMTRVGLSPKMYLRIVRFENAMRIKNSSPEKSWSEIAFECDYNDSSHLLREFRQFAEFPPGTLLKKQSSGYGDFPTG